MCPRRKGIWKSLIYFQRSTTAPSYFGGVCFKIHIYFLTKHSPSLSTDFAYDWLHFTSRSALSLAFEGFVLIGWFQRLRLLIALGI